MSSGSNSAPVDTIESAPIDSSPIRRTGSGTKRIIRDGMWLVVGEGWSALGMLAGVRIVTSAYSPSVYAAANLLFGLVTFARNLFYQPFMQAALRFYPEAAKNETVPTLRRVLLWYINRVTIAVAPTACIFGLFCAYQGDVSILSPAVLIAILLVEALRTMEVALLNAARQQRVVAILRPYDAWSRPILAVAFGVVFGSNDLAILTGYLLAGLTGYGLIFLLGIKPIGYESQRQTVPDDPAYVAQLRSRIWKFALPMAPIAIVEWPLLFSVRYILGALDGLDAAGVYAAGCGLAATPFIMCQVAVENWLRPIYFEAVEERDSVRSFRILALYIGTTLAICCVGILGLLVLGSWVTDVMLDVRYRRMGPLLPVIALGNSMYALCQVIEKVFHVHHCMHLCLLCRTIGAIACLAITIPMIAYFGLVGASWSAPMYFGVQLLVTIFFARIVSKRSSIGDLG